MCLYTAHEKYGHTTYIQARLALRLELLIQPRPMPLQLVPIARPPVAGIGQRSHP